MSIELKGARMMVIKNPSAQSVVLGGKTILRNWWDSRKRKRV